MASAYGEFSGEIPARHDASRRAALGGFLFGFDTSTMNAAINGIRPTPGLSGVAIGFAALASIFALNVSPETRGHAFS